MQDEFADSQAAAFEIVIESVQIGATRFQTGARSSLRAFDGELARARIALDEVDQINLPIGSVEAKQDDGP